MKILLISPYSRDANSFWRCMGPMNYLAKSSCGSITVETPPPGTQLAWDVITRYDLIFMHRPCRRDDLIVMQIAKNANIPVWADYDDWLFHLPEWNPHKGAYNNPNMQSLIAHLTATADVISVTTGALQKALSKINDNVIIVPNAYPSVMLPWRANEPGPRKITYVWRGTATHDGDLLSVKEGLKSLHDTLHVCGDLPYAIKSEMDESQYKLIPHQDVLIYWQSIYQMAPKFMVFPLHDCFFNRCKSNIAWIEATHAGALTIAPDLPEWRQPGVISFKPGDNDSFMNAIQIANDLKEDDRKDHVAKAFTYIKETYDITVINEIRRKLCSALLSSDFKKNTKSPYDSAVGLWALSQLKKVDE
jgi:hypothetical protein